jgi:hypothetical protein
MFTRRQISAIRLGRGTNGKIEPPSRIPAGDNKVGSGPASSTVRRYSKRHGSLAGRCTIRQLSCSHIYSNLFALPVYLSRSHLVNKTDLATMVHVFFQLLGGSIGLAYVLQRYGSLPTGILSTAVIIFSLSLVCYATWAVVIYPRYFSPLRHIPTAPDDHFLLGHTRKVVKAPSGAPSREWM